MLRDFVIGDVLVPGFVAVFLLSVLVFVPLRAILVSTRVERWVWHRPLFETAVFVLILSALFAAAVSLNSA